VSVQVYFNETVEKELAEGYNLSSSVRRVLMSELGSGSWGVVLRDDESGETVSGYYVEVEYSGATQVFDINIRDMDSTYKNISLLFFFRGANYK
jgi:hypothetical protein